MIAEGTKFASANDVEQSSVEAEAVIVSSFVNVIVGRPPRGLTVH